MRTGAVVRRLAPLTLLGALLLSACGAEAEERVAPYPVEMPDPPPEVQHLDAAGISPQLTTLLLGVNQAADTHAHWEGMYDVSESGPEEIIDYYDDWLTAEGWEQGAGLTEFNGAPAGRWEGQDQQVMVFVVTLQERDIAVVLTATDQWEAP